MTTIDRIQGDGAAGTMDFEDSVINIYSKVLNS